MSKISSYKGQALAIVMIVLVISVVLGMAMLSRVLKDNLRVVDEQSSAEALEVSDSIFDAVKGTTISDLKTVCQNAEYGGADITTGAECVATGTSEVNQFLSEVGVASSATESLSNCQNDTSTVELKTSIATENDDYEIRPDTVRSFVLRGQVPNPNTCTLSLTVEPRGSTVGGLIVSKIYGRNYVNGVASEYKAYSYSDISPYCIFSTGGDCSANPNLQNSWTAISSKTPITISLAPSGTYNLDEIRVRSVNSTVAIKASLSNPNCIKDWQMIKMEVGANCTGSYRAKEIQVPQQEWALPIFDYVVYNGNGILTPQDE